MQERHSPRLAGTPRRRRRASSAGRARAQPVPGLCGGYVESSVAYCVMPSPPTRSRSASARRPAGSRTTRRAEEDGTRTRGRRCDAGESKGRRADGARAARARTRRSGTGDRRLRVLLVVGEPAADGSPDERAEDREHREDGKRRRVEPRREQRPAPGGGAFRVGLDEVDRGGDREEHEPEPRRQRDAHPRRRAARTPTMRCAARSAARALTRRQSRRASSSAIPTFTTAEQERGSSSPARSSAWRRAGRGRSASSCSGRPSSATSAIRPNARPERSRWWLRPTLIPVLTPQVASYFNP